MSQRPPVVRPNQVIRALERAGWVVKRQRGSHASMRKPGSPMIVTVPMKRRDVAPGTLRDIIKDAGMTVEEFVALL